MKWDWQAWIFDLDDTLLDTSGELIPLVAQKVCAFLVEQKIYSSFSEVNKIWLNKKELFAGQILIQKMIEEKTQPNDPEETLHFARRENSLVRQVNSRGSESIANHKLAKNSKKRVNRTQIEEWVQQAYQIFRTPPIPDRLNLLPGAVEVLTQMRASLPLFLVTQGDIPTQMKKVMTLGIADFFRHVYYVDPVKGENKSQAFQSILRQFQFNPEQVLSIGNRLDNEIELSNQLGMQTCYLPYGEHRLEVAQNSEQEPDYVIQSLADLHALMPKLLKPSSGTGVA